MAEILSFFGRLMVNLSWSVKEFEVSVRGFVACGCGSDNSGRFHTALEQLKTRARNGDLGFSIQSTRMQATRTGKTSLQ
jgi:hypothetical protein